ncbi:MAG TPA: MFS transporter [Candidatus Tectomicrobia bacterium]|nr:MFS transporter [Candidatus Tectomicrobia bacterium]
MRFLLAFAQGGVLSPLLPLLREAFHVGYGELGLLISMFGLSRVAMDIMAAYLLSRIPLFRLLLWGIILTGSGSLLCAFAPGFYWLVGARVLVGLGISMTTLAGLTVIIESTPLTSQGRANNLLEFSAIGGSAVSPTLSGLMASLIHWRAAFALGTLFVAGAFAWVLLTREALEEDTRALTRKAAFDSDATRAPPEDKERSHLAHTTAILIAYLTTFMLSFTWSGFLSTAIPLYGGEVVGLSTSTLGMVLTAGLLADLGLLLPVGWLSDRLDYRVVLAPALLLMAVTLAWFPQAQGLWGLFLVSIGIHTSFAAWGMPSAALAQLARGERLRRTMAVYRFLVDGAVVVAPWLIGTLVGRYGYELPSWITAAGVLLTAVLVTRGLRAAPGLTRRAA